MNIEEWLLVFQGPAQLCANLEKKVSATRTAVSKMVSFAMTIGSYGSVLTHCYAGKSTRNK